MENKVDKILDAIDKMAKDVLEQEEVQLKGELVKALDAYILKAAQDVHKQLVGYAKSIIDPSEDRSEEEVNAKEQDNVDVEGRDS